MEMQESLGIAVFMHNCAFEIEIDRESIPSSIQEIDYALDELAIKTDDNSRIAEVLQNAFALSGALCKNEMESITAITEMAFAFLYVYNKQYGEVSKNTRGIISFLTKDYVHFSTCLEAEKFNESVLKAKNLRAKILGDFEDRTPPKPTLH